MNTTIPSPAFTWTLADEGAVLTGCGSAASHVRVPSEALGRPVIGIADRAFLNAADLTGVALPDSLRFIGDAAFYGCANLRLVRLPDGLTRLGDAAFQGCERLAQARLGAGLREIPPRAFYLCRRLDGIRLPEGVAAIGDRAFAGCASLRSVWLPEGLEAIGPLAFAGCGALEALDIPGSVTALDASALPPRFFDRGTLYLPRQGLLVRATASLRYRAPEGTRHIAAGALAGNHDITEILLPDTVESAGDRAFADCRCLHYIRLPDPMALGREAFAGCRALAAVALPASTKALAEGLFEDSGLTTLTLPAGVRAVGDRAFAGCASLRSVRLNPGLRHIGAAAFARCAALEALALPESLESIGPGALAGCAGLRTLVVAGALPGGIERALAATDLRAVEIFAPRVPPEAFPPLWRKRVCLGYARAAARGEPCSPEAAQGCVEWLRAHAGRLAAEAAGNDALLRLLLDERCLAPDDARRLVDRLSRQDRPEAVLELLNYLRAGQAKAEDLW